MRLPIVGVMGSGSEAHEARASRLGAWLADLGVHLLTGGGGGVMASVSKAFYAQPGRRGSVIGVLPSDSDGVCPKRGYPNPWVEIPIVTHLPLSGDRGRELASRNHINVLSSDVIVALPGGAGTRSEVELALAYDRRIVAFVGSPSERSSVPKGVLVKSAFEDVCDFVREHVNFGR